MAESVKRHLPVIVVVSLVGIVTAYFALSNVHGAAAGMDVGAFSSLIFWIPCLIMFVCATVIALTAHQIGRQMYLVVVGICLVAGIVCMVVTSSWLADSAIASALLANSEQGAEVTPILNSPIIILRDIAAFFVAGTVGCILGAWIGSRLHPMTADARKGGRSKSRKR